MRSDAQSYDAIAREVFAPLYPFYAARILDTTGVTAGCCVDVGCGGGYLGLALAERADLFCCFLDKSPEMLRLAAANVVLRGMLGRAAMVLADVHAIPLSDSSVDLVISRGSLPFWDDLPLAFRDIQRVLKPGGYAHIGCGLGPAEVREAIQEEMLRRDPNWRAGGPRNQPQRDTGDYMDALQRAGIKRSTVIRNDLGTWIEFRKGE